jgi:type III pantothenate kinase
MTWLFDVGNTRVKWARAHGARPGPVQACAHADVDPDSVLAGIQPGDTAWIASVATDAVTAPLLAALQAAGSRVRRVRTQPAALGVRIAYAEPAHLGVDRFLALLAAHARDDGPWLLVSVGSALTIDLLDIDGTHHGGLIAPTPDHMRGALAERFPVLAGRAGQVTDWARDTDDAVASGTLLSAVGLIERAHRHAQAQLGRAVTVLVSGGGSDAVRAHLSLPSHVVEAPVLAGLARLAAAEPA